MKKIKLKSFISLFIFLFIISGLAIKALSSEGIRGIINNNIKAFGRNEIKDEMIGDIEFPDFYKIVSNDIYYVSPYDKKIYKMSLESGERHLICDVDVYQGSMLLGDNGIYYVDEEDLGLYLYKAGSRKMERISDEDFYMPFDNIIKFKGNVFYYNETGDINNALNRDIKKVPNGLKKRIGYGAKLNKGILYSWSDFGVISVDIDSGAIKTVLKEDVYPMFNVFDDYIYYISNIDGRLYRVDVEGKNRILLSSASLVCEGGEYDLGRVEIYNNKLYFIEYGIDGSSKFVASDLDGKNKKTVSNKASDFMIGEKGIYFFDSVDNGTMYQLDFEHKFMNEIDKGDFTYFIDSYKGKILYGKKSFYEWDPMYGKIFILIEENPRGTPSPKIYELE